MTTLIVVVGLAVYVLLYLTYGKKLEKNVVKATDDETPSQRMYDGVDYVPAKAPVLFGHHFASIAGAAPIVGPVLAMAWGWVPGLLWVWFGNIFIGAVHDYLALMASVRYDGRSVQFVASDVIAKRTGKTFYWLVFFLLILVIGAFGAVLGNMFIANGQVPSAYILKLVAALILGVLLYRVKMNFTAATVIGIIMLILAIIGGHQFPINASRDVWMLVMFFYIIIASAVPVNILLQPRDYLNSWLLYIGLAIGGIAAIFSFTGFTAPAFTSFSPIVSGGQPSPFWPVIPLIIACGSLSGFHALVGSGTTSKQIEKERHGLPIGYGAMLTEGFLSTIVIISVSGFGLSIIQGAGQDLTVANWGSAYAGAMNASFGAATTFTNSYAAMVDSTFLTILPTEIVKVIAGMWVASFAMTTLDTTNRLGRYTLTEILMPMKAKNEGMFNFLTNRWIASTIPAIIGIYLAWSGSFTVLWPSFGSANQLIASIALLTGAAWVVKRQKAKNANIVLIPAYLLWITVTAAIIWFSVVVLPGTIENDPVTGIVVLIIEIVMLIMNFVFIIDFLKNKNKPLASEA
ncbi:MAG: carbon starvation protein A [Synergistales bacterium]|nr:carbon starvation protein A [Synergistales bacterium]MCF7948777.1 carbon starvation protein A [Spirochaetia bacterium]